MSVTLLQRPECHSFQIGLNQGANSVLGAVGDGLVAAMARQTTPFPAEEYSLIGIVKQEITGQPLLGKVVNQGTSNLVITASASADNGQTDAYSGHVVSLRVNGATVTSVTVVPGAAVVFTIESTGGLPYLRFDQNSGATPPVGQGFLSLATYCGTLDRRDIDGYP